MQQQWQNPNALISVSSGNNITLTPDECDTLKRYAVNGIIANADNKCLKEKLVSAEKSVSIWKQRYETINEKYTGLKKKAQPYLDVLEIALERILDMDHLPEPPDYLEGKFNFKALIGTIEKMKND